MPNPLWTCDERLGGTRLGKVRFSAAGDKPAAARINANQKALRGIEAHMILKPLLLSKAQRSPYNIAAPHHRLVPGC